MRNIAHTDLTQAMTVLIAEHMHFLFLILKKSEMRGEISSHTVTLSYTVLMVYMNKGWKKK